MAPAPTTYGKLKAVFLRLLNATLEAPGRLGFGSTYLLGRCSAHSTSAGLAVEQVLDRS